MQYSYGHTCLVGCYGPAVTVRGLGVRKYCGLLDWNFSREVKSGGWIMYKLIKINISINMYTEAIFTTPISLECMEWSMDSMDQSKPFHLIPKTPKCYLLGHVNKIPCFSSPPASIFWDRTNKIYCWVSPLLQDCGRSYLASSGAWLCSWAELWF